jgi:DNA-binding response OmpR family regulator
MTQEWHRKQQLDGPTRIKMTRNVNKILLIDDEPDVTITFKAILQEVGFIVDTYEDPLIALSDFKPGFYDLIILDIKIPKMNGFELYAELQKIDSQVKMCFVTADEMYYNRVRKQGEQQYCVLDTDRFLRKPISSTNLLERVEKIIILNKSKYIQSK